MDLVTLVPDIMLLRVRLALPRGFALRVAESVDGPRGLEAALDGSPVQLVMLDPADPRVAPHVRRVANLLQQYDWVPCVAYTTLTPAGIVCLPDLFHGGAQGLLLYGIDDGTTAIRDLIVRLTADAVANQLLEALSRPMKSLPPGVSHAIRFLFASPHRFPSVEDLASAAALSRRHLHRLVTDAGLTSPTQLLVVARVLRAYQLLRAGRITLQQAAVRLRLAPRILSRHVRATTAVAGARSLADLSATELVTRCVHTLYRPPAALRLAAGGDVHPGSFERNATPPSPPRRHR